MGPRTSFPPRRTTPAARRALPACLALCLGSGGVAGCSAGPGPHVVECSLVFPAEPATAGSAPTRSTIEEQHLSGNYAALLTALAAPSDRQDGINCTLQLEITPDLWLVNAAGRAVQAIWPRDACGFSKPATAKALAGLHVASTKTLEMPVAP